LGKTSHLGGDTDELGVMLRKALTTNQTLTSLDFSKCHFDSVTFVAMSGSFMQMKALKSLKLNYLELDEPCTLQLCNALDSFPITTLSIANCAIGESAKSASLLSEALGHAQTLTNLNVGNNKLGGRCCEKLASFLKGETIVIRTLNMEGNNFGAEGGMEIASALSHCHSLTSLDLSNNDLGEDVGCEIAESLREIVSFGVVKRRTHIKHLEISNNPFGGLACIEIIKSFYNEVTLYIGLSNVGLDEACGEAIGEGLRKPTIHWESLDLSHNKLAKEGANAVWWSMRKNNSVFYLNMSYNEIGAVFGTSDDERGNHGISIDSALARNFTLRYLNMEGNGLSAAAGVSLAESLAVNASVQHLNFKGNNLDYVVGETLGWRLQDDEQIKSCNLNGNYMGWKGGLALANALFTNRFLVSMDLGYNKLGENGSKVGIAIAKSLFQNNVLRTLILCGNRLGPQSGFMFAETLRKNKSLTYLDFENNRINEEVGEKFHEMVNENFALMELKLSDVEIGADLHGLIWKVIDERQ